MPICPQLPAFISGVLIFSAVAAVAAPLNIEDFTGVYKHRETVETEIERHTFEDVLEIVKVSPVKAYVRAELRFANYHHCKFYGLAAVENTSLVYRKAVSIWVRKKGAKVLQPVKAQCELRFKRDGDRIVIEDKGDICTQSHDLPLVCGARGLWQGATFDMKTRRTIRYMPRLLASREYLEAMKE